MRGAVPSPLCAAGLSCFKHMSARRRLEAFARIKGGYFKWIFNEIACTHKGSMDSVCMTFRDGIE